MIKCCRERLAEKPDDFLLRALVDKMKVGLVQELLTFKDPQLKISDQTREASLLPPNVLHELGLAEESPPMANKPRLLNFCEIGWLDPFEPEHDENGPEVLSLHPLSPALKR